MWASPGRKPSSWETKKGRGRSRGPGVISYLHCHGDGKKLREFAWSVYFDSVTKLGEGASADVVLDEIARAGLSRNRTASYFTE